ncbi:MAG: alpha/beta hydrolase [Anaerolineaceae bacterium]|nr:alpha/beta hydrolase [Anaerolineaceae bacterium]
MSIDWDEKIKTTLMIATAGCGLMAAAGNILYDYMINRNQSYMFGPFRKYKESVKIGEFFRTDLSEETMSWAEKTPFSQTQTHAYDGTTLNAYCFEQPKPTKHWLIAVHGYGQSASSLFPFVKPFYENGYNVMLPECRGCGRSGGNYYGLGWADRMDVVKWARQICAEHPSAEIILFGLSTGADAVLMASGEDNLPTNVRCIIADSAYSKLTDLSNYILKQHNMPSGLLTFATSMVTYLRAGYSFMQASAVNQTARSHTPTLFIHGGQDEIFPVEMCYELYEAASCPKEICIVQEASHGYAMFADYENYWNHIRKFTEKYIPAKAQETSYMSKLKNRFRKSSSQEQNN